MNDRHPFEHEIRDVLDEHAPMLPPNHLLQSFEFNARRTRRYPRWLALIKEPTMRTNNHLAVGSPAARVTAILVATVLLTVALAIAGIAGQRLLAADDEIIVVAQNGSGDYMTINEAVSVAGDGDEIVIMPGEYEESVRIARDITLRGEERDSVIIIVGRDCVEDAGSGGLTCPEGTSSYDGYWTGPAPYGILVDRADAHISDLTARTLARTKDSGSAADADIWAFTAVGGAPTFEHVATDHGSRNHGSFYAHEGSAAQVLSSEFDDWVLIEEQSPVKLTGNTLKGEVMVNTSNTPLGGVARAELRDNELWSLAFAGPVAVTDNTFTNFRSYIPNTHAISVDNGDGWTISGNEISRYAAGIRQFAGSGGDVLGNTIVDSDTGILVTIGPEHRVASNRVEGGDLGIRAGGSGLVEDNEVTGASKQGFMVPVGATVTLTGNTACDNGQDLVVARNTTPTIDDSNTFCDQG